MSRNNLIKRVTARFFRKCAERVRGYNELNRLRKIFATTNIECVIDCGFHRGSFTKQILKLRSFKGPIMAFEANQAVYNDERLKFQRYDRVTLQNLAVSDHSGQSDFYVTNGEQLSSIFKPTSTYHENLNSRTQVTEVVKIGTLRLDSIKIFDTYKSILLKIDVQGAELKVLKGCTGMLKNVSCIQVEVPFIELYEGSTSFDQIHDFLVLNGFGISSIFNNNEGHFPFQVDMDFIYLNKKHFINE